MDYAIETTCVTIAKDRNRSRGACTGKETGRKGWSGGGLAHLLQRRKNAEADFFNGVVRYSAEEGQVDKAERWMLKLDSRRGVHPHVTALNALMLAEANRGDLAQAEAWFERTLQRAIHPELGDLTPNVESYDILVQRAAEAGDLARMEKFLQACCSRGFRPARRSFLRAVQALVGAGEPRRAHHWMEAMVREGSTERADYAPREVKRVLRLRPSLRPWDAEELVEVILGLARRLAEAHNSSAADQWLGYLTECGEKPSMHIETWEYVRALTPPEIVPARLTAGVERVDFKPEPPLLLPASLSGEPPREVIPGQPYAEISRSPGAGFQSARILRPAAHASNEPGGSCSGGSSARVHTERALCSPGGRRPRAFLGPAPDPIVGLTTGWGDGGRAGGSPKGGADNQAVPMSPGLRRLVQLQHRSAVAASSVSPRVKAQALVRTSEAASQRARNDASTDPSRAPSAASAGTQGLAAESRRPSKGIAGTVRQLYPGEGKVPPRATSA
eukprot:CAMPEP_0179020236 /NCGR_PEP_ID=MMETSP0796-20121207/5277_1 /TAXON_ID=73915 /ORGANISM="Pyrodinium bahamense, Strain pbaha01" /LENGTH=502 /DNA_ID=CAMNT_0020716043 /DNA_START=88 /DNA_END=1593 /DNA_ORIENTATION=+